MIPSSPTVDEQADVQRVQAIDAEIAHVWMVRTFLKHCDEAEDDDDLREIVRELYDVILALGPLEEVEDPKGYLKQAKKKLARLRRASEFYDQIQAEVSGHTNFVMAAKSLRVATQRITAILQQPSDT